MRQQFQVVQPTQDPGNAGLMAGGAAIGCGLIILYGILYLPFAIADLVYGYSDQFCTLLIPTSVGFPMYTWLLVDGYTKLGMFIFVVLWVLLLMFFISQQSAGGTLSTTCCFFTIVVLYQIFNFAWLVVGAVMFWGAIITVSGVCSAGFIAYMYIVLIWGFLGIFISACCNRRGQGAE